MKGCGRIQRAILKLIDDGGFHLYAPKELARSVYHGPAACDKQRIVVRAAQSLARKYPENIALAEDENRDVLWVIGIPPHRTLKRPQLKRSALPRRTLPRSAAARHRAYRARRH
jgi:hypothetical protein